MFKITDNIIMKRLIILASLLFASFCLFAEEDKVVRSDFGLTTGIPVYSRNDDLVSIEESRAIFGITTDVSFRLAKPLRFLLGADVTADLMFDGSDYNHHLDYAGWAGIRFYPGFGGLAFSVAYALGSRTDFICESDYEKKKIVLDGRELEYFDKSSKAWSESTAWGNGFRVGFDYDFLYDNSHVFAPALGAYYRCMPRGNNNWDNIFSIYITFGLQ